MHGVVIAGDIDASTLILAVYAAGDVHFTPGNGQLGHTWELALAEHAGRKAAPDAWRRVMTSGASAILPPSEHIVQLSLLGFATAADFEIRVAGLVGAGPGKEALPTEPALAPIDPSMI